MKEKKGKRQDKKREKKEFPYACGESREERDAPH
jgi:hypothetical protein